jgi:Lon-like ATP-dependent protease
MEVLEVSGYVAEEKLAIADRYLAPQAKTASGLEDTDIKLDPAAITALIRYYCRESGVRNLKKHIDKVSSLYLASTSVILTDGSLADLPKGSLQDRNRSRGEGIT